MKKITVAEVYLWGTLVGHVSWNEKTDVGAFEYDAKFLKAPVEPSPIKMPKKKTIYSFREIDRKTFKGLPGMLSDSLPDKYGNALIDVGFQLKVELQNPLIPLSVYVIWAQGGWELWSLSRAVSKRAKTKIRLKLVRWLSWLPIFFQTEKALKNIFPTEIIEN